MKLSIKLILFVILGALLVAIMIGLTILWVGNIDLGINFTFIR